MMSVSTSVPAISEHPAELRVAGRLVAYDVDLLERVGVEIAVARLVVADRGINVEAVDGVVVVVVVVVVVDVGSSALPPSSPHQEVTTTKTTSTTRV
jgi:hypothetical protein